MTEGASDSVVAALAREVSDGFMLRAGTKSHRRSRFVRYQSNISLHRIMSQRRVKREHVARINSHLSESSARVPRSIRRPSSASAREL